MGHQVGAAGYAPDRTSVLILFPFGAYFVFALMSEWLKRAGYSRASEGGSDGGNKRLGE
jgi:hypothetical protein